MLLSGFHALDAQEPETFDTAQTGNTGITEFQGEQQNSDEQPREDSLVFNLRLISEDTLTSRTRDKGFYYKNYFDSLLRATQPAALPRQRVRRNYTFLDGFLEIVTWIAVIGIILFIVYKLIPGNSSLFVRHRKNTGAENIPLEENGRQDTEALIQAAIARGDYRTAVRFLFLLTISKLADHGYIRTGREKTNQQYLTELKTQPWVNEFADLSRRYEYVWYGDYPVSRAMFEHINLLFSDFNRQFNR